MGFNVYHYSQMLCALHGWPVDIKNIWGKMSIDSQ